MYLNLFEVAYVLRSRRRGGLTIAQVCGAIRALRLRDDKTTVFVTKAHGAIIPKQQTMVHRSKVKDIEAYFSEED
jgi:hypothetical protein